MFDREACLDPTCSSGLRFKRKKHAGWPMKHLKTGALARSAQDGTAWSPGEALERGGAKQAIGCDVTVFHFGQECRLLPGRFGIADWLSKLRRRRYRAIDLPADLAGHGAGPARSDLARVDQVSSFLPAEVER